MAVSSPRRLTTWKDIGAYIGRDARTAKRYEAERRLPVHRLPGEARSVVFAFSEELDAWLKHQTFQPPRPEQVLVAPAPAATLEPEHVPARPNGLRLHRAALGIAAFVTVVGLGAAAAVILMGSRRSGATGGGSDPVAAAAYRDGEFAWRQRTPESLKRAVDDFTQAIVRDPGFADAYIGLANSYDLMPEFGDMSPADAYKRAEAAVTRALALTPHSAAAHRTYAFILFWWEHEVPRAFAEFQTALRLDPDSIDAHHWYANALAEVRDPRALKEIDTARSLDPASTSVMIDAGWARVMLGRYAEARQILQTVEGVTPDAPTVHSGLAYLDRLQEDYPRMLSELAVVARLRHDPQGEAIAAAGQRGFASGGAGGMWAAMVPLEEVANHQDRLPSSFLAADELRLGRRAESVRLLEDAFARREPGLLGLRGSPDFASLRDDPVFRRLVARVGAPG